MVTDWRNLCRLWCGYQGPEIASLRMPDSLQVWLAHKDIKDNVTMVQGRNTKPLDFSIAYRFFLLSRSG